MVKLLNILRRWKLCLNIPNGVHCNVFFLFINNSLTFCSDKHQSGFGFKTPEKQDFQGSNHSQNINKRKNKYLSIKMCNSLSSSFTNVMVADIRMQFKGRKTIPIILLVSNTQINQAHYRLRPVRNGNEI